ncbi:MAG: alkaline phosphatase D family protein [Myxococcota bacterium]|nr:alkaline phosphatase D family protein [Myxococcota bacterium]
MINRRHFMKTSVAAAGCLMVGVRCGESSTYKDGAAYFPQSLASGDPKSDSVILWTRAVDPKRPTADLSVQLEVALDPSFDNPISFDGSPSLTLKATAGSDHCIKVRITSLQPHTTYYYRFLYKDAKGQSYTSHTGRTRTAPAANTDTPVQFAVVSCQDYNARYYNTLRRLADEDVDFIVHLGDYVYETSERLSFQDSSETRNFSFSQPDEALTINPGQSDSYQAAKSVGNYRDLYKTYRSDPDLQRLHELFPFIIIWDDHEFSDDSFGATGTYYDGAEDEHNVPRRKAANQAWFEFMPVDYMDNPDFQYDPDATYPDDIRIYRDFTFGKHVHLVMTDLRSYRPDHLVAEKMAPWKIAVTSADLTQYATQITTTLGEAADAFPEAYVPSFDDLSAGHQDLLRSAALNAGVPEAEVEESVQGAVSVAFLNSLIADEDLDTGELAPIDETSLERGIAYHHMGKWSYHSALGSRQLVVETPYRIFALVQYLKTQGESEQIMGATQEDWFLATMRESTATWKVWGNEFIFSPMLSDVTGLVNSERFSQKFQVSSEDWHAQPNRRDFLLEELGTLDNVVLVTGDIHAFYASTTSPKSDPNKGLVEFVTGAVSSKTYRAMLLNKATSDPVLAAAGAAGLAFGIDQILTSSQRKTNPGLAFADSDKNGFIVIKASATELVATLHMIDGKHATTHQGEGAALNALFETTRFRVKAGSHQLHLEESGALRAWCTETAQWKAPGSAT